MTETRYLAPPGADWAVWDDANGVLTFMTDAQAVENARQNEALPGGEFGRGLPPDPTPEEAWAYVNELWEGDPGGRGWYVRVPPGATGGGRASAPRRAARPSRPPGAVSTQGGCLGD